MKIGPFLLFTFLGAGLWNVILAVVGYFAYDKREYILPYLDWIMYAVGALFVIWLAWKGLQVWTERHTEQSERSTSVSSPARSRSPISEIFAL
ncbi:MAG: hypothetical protein MZV63_02825 [Marinilabiliales bacterium]|nr:hypothetical protein [Marinilabiliales bacterium]